MGLIDTVRSLIGLPARSIVYPPMSPGIDNWWPYVNFGGSTYSMLGLNETLRNGREEIDAGSFRSLTQHAYKGNGVVFAVMLTRLLLFGQVRLQYQRMRKGRPDELWGDASLNILEHPWANATTSDLLHRAITDVDLSGNFYATRRGNRIVRLEPDNVSIVIGSERDDDVLPGDIDADILGYVYYPGGRYSGRTPHAFAREEVAHFTLVPDPTAWYRGMSWISPLIREVMGDTAANTHKLQFFEHGATPNMVIKRSDSVSKETFRDWVALMREGNEGAANAYRSLFLDAGADATVVGADFKQIDFKVTQGAGETRIAAAGRVHPAVVGLSEGLQGASLNAGNFSAARRLVADGFLYPAWSNFAGSMETLVRPPSGSRLSYDPRDVPFLREDRKAAAEIELIKAQIIRTLTDGGYAPDSIKKAVEGEDMSVLEWTGLVSVQLQPPGMTTPEATAPLEVAPSKATNGAKTPKKA